ncbi:MAG: glycoside hydrolase family 32 protein [Butyrivibrio sp.]|nr:glycoside hydrolase family 32 protein [Butyrivibrio sp.]
MSDKLQKAREYEAEYGGKIGALDRPLFHLTPYVGWMNDPNGFSYYKGKYHMFYQYYPYESRWNDMHWGHAVSSDLLTWEYLPASMAPDMPFDEGGCFSGSAVEISDGRQLLMYTGLQAGEKDGRKVHFQVQNIAIGDGLNYEKYENNPVIDKSMLPEGADDIDFRDPKVIRLKSGEYVCIVGSRPEDGSGQILMYKSADAIHWKYWKKLIENKNRYGKMWECPDFFELDGKWLLLTSPQDMLADGLEYHNGNGTVCVMGSFDENTGDFKEERNQAIDYGIDFYAPQTVLAPDGRRIMIGWLQNWDGCAVRDQGELWAGQMSVPREIWLQNGRLYQKPVKELENYRKDKVTADNLELSGEMTIPGVSGRCVDMEVVVRPKNPENIYHKFAVNFAEDEKRYSSVSFRPHEATLKVDRKYSGSRRAIVHQRRCLVEESKNGEIRLRIILDRFSAEVFVNDGAKVMSMGVYTDITADEISFYCDGEAVVDLVKYDIKASK